MPLASPSSSSWYLPRFSAEEMDAALSSFQSRELQELSSSKLPLFDLPSGLDDSSLEIPGLDLYIDPSNSDS